MAVAGAAPATAHVQASGSELLRWACHGWSYESPLRIGVKDLGPGRGRGLVALQDIPAGETLLSVPFNRVFTSEAESELHWSTEMAARLLRARHETRAAAAAAAAAAPSRSGAASTTSASAAATGAGQAWGPWVAALPAAVRTPLEYDETETAQLGCPYVAQEVQGMQSCVADCYEVLQPDLDAIGCGWEDFLWAVQVFHSRCFVDPATGRHLCVPGVDMANHSPHPTAAVRIVHSPAACQGYDAVAEVAEPPPPEPSRFTLVAGEEGLGAGQEVTITYGAWPSEAFLLLFGFVPEQPVDAEGARGVPPHESLILFRDAADAAAWAVEEAGPAAPAHPDGSEAAAEALLAEALGALPPELGAADGLMQLVVTSEGVDARLQALLAALCGAAGAQGLVLPPAQQLLRRRVAQRADQVAAAAASADEAVRAFGRAKRRVAEAVLQRLG